MKLTINWSLISINQQHYKSVKETVFRPSINISRNEAYIINEWFSSINRTVSAEKDYH